MDKEMQVWQSMSQTNFFEIVILILNDILNQGVKI